MWFVKIECHKHIFEQAALDFLSNQCFEHFNQVLVKVSVTFRLNKFNFD